MYSFNQLIEKLKQNQVIAYPTEAVFGLGCNPQSEQAMRSLLQLKNRPEDKGLILIAHHKELLLPYIDDTHLTEVEWQRFETLGEQAITWIMPAKATVPRYLKGQFETIAVRLCQVPAVVELCTATGFALTSTSANLTTLPPCRTADEVRQQFGNSFPVLDQATGGKSNPSEIRDIFSQHIFRQG
ncbi:tRNA threonylcarbamoyladenosine biosynthesis protein RimN [Glaesserella parasuis]|uniref:Threonylcarbamoyl-AMP synthase n=1 Tax=Glaesserella parasuis HPS10 TaxID=1450514 RepID=A0A836MD99_GLAPU|nr:Sua5/YciO/YrdC/YwlC family protein [Glaesserella parasuis]KDB47219.1 tRNA threonylcarbamoyladenosine biosynthesis protein RimN [Glaesserella parasuis HPS10]MCT8539808.1 Sua5/YciO/YrdC/YwlC family protein [Glaesserella parasuis]MCT8750105.1 Sua5/YciO/YrdC/YwlC family protein [Glaesserella parasuis]MCT8842430.1 Sua5/YciO/YrdC/YwlC family protein [Glaesserella parasuis]MDD2173849.1 Sua5/YciO/YrdC/YwlC family protein [Glaesserella parasuis]